MYRHAEWFGLPSHGAQNIICFKPFQFQNGNVERLNHFLDALNLQAQFIGHLFAGAFVLFKHIIAEGAPQVEADGKIFGRIFGQYPVENGADKAEGGIGGFAAFGGEGFDGEGKKHAVGQSVAINENKLVFRHANPFVQESFS